MREGFNESLSADNGVFFGFDNGSMFTKSATDTERSVSNIRPFTNGAVNTFCYPKRRSEIRTDKRRLSLRELPV